MSSVYISTPREVRREVKTKWCINLWWQDGCLQGWNLPCGSWSEKSETQNEQQSWGNECFIQNPNPKNQSSSKDSQNAESKQSKSIIQRIFIPRTSEVHNWKTCRRQGPEADIRSSKNREAELDLQFWWMGSGRGPTPAKYNKGKTQTVESLLKGNRQSDKVRVWEMLLI